MLRSFVVVLLINSPFAAVAQPGTEILLFDLKVEHDSIWVESGRNITNRQGYDNQPFFHPDEPLLFFVSADHRGQTDIFNHNYKTGLQTQVTRTADKEYSPTVTPDRQHISCIIQRENGAQHLGRYPVVGGEAEILINDLIVGYHAWIDQDQLALFVLPQPFRLYVSNLTKRTDTVRAEDIGRSLNRIPGTNAISFVQKMGDNAMVKELSGQTGKISVLTKSISTAEHDMAWTPDGKMIMSEGNKLFYWSRNGGDHRWTEIPFATDRPSQSISRIAISPNGRLIALVINE